MEDQSEPIESISAVTLLTLHMDKAVTFYQTLGFHLLYGDLRLRSRASASAPATSTFNSIRMAWTERPSGGESCSGLRMSTPCTSEPLTPSSLRRAHQPTPLGVSAISTSTTRTATG